MSDAVIVALIGLLGSGAGAFGGILVSSKLTQYRLEQLEKKVQAHNNLIERMYKVEGRLDTMEQALEDHNELSTEKIDATNQRIDDLQGAVKA